MSILLINPEIRANYQRGIYLYAKSLVAGLKGAAGGAVMLTDFMPKSGSSLGSRDLVSLIDSPPKQKVRSLQMVPRYLGFKLGLPDGAEDFVISDIKVPDRIGYISELAGVVNVPMFYEVCRLAASKPFFDAVDVDFLQRRSGVKACFTTAPVAIKSGMRSLPIVQTVHDLIALNSTVHKVNVDKFRRRLDFAVRYADVVLAVSEFTRNEVVERYPALDGRVRVLYQPLPASDEDIMLSEQLHVQSEVLAKFDLRKDEYFFYVGAIEERKNIHRLVQAFKGEPSFANKKLVLAGSADESYLRANGIWADFFEPITSSHGDAIAGNQVIYLGRISEVEKLCLLRSALMFVFPTITEGFGIPLLEAQSMGCPVLTTDSSAIPEVVGATALLVSDPTDVDEIRTQMKVLSEDSQLRQKFRTDGLINASRFSKANFARQLSELISEISH